MTIHEILILSLASILIIGGIAALAGWLTDEFFDLLGWHDGGIVYLALLVAVAAVIWQVVGS